MALAKTMPDAMPRKIATPPRRGVGVLCTSRVAHRGDGAHAKREVTHRGRRDVGEQRRDRHQDEVDLHPAAPAPSTGTSALAPTTSTISSRLTPPTRTIAQQVAGCVDDRGRDAERAVAAIEVDVDRVLELLPRVLGSDRRRRSGAVRARHGERAGAFEHRTSCGVSRHAQGDGSTGLAKVPREARLSPHDHRERAGPERLHERPRWRGNVAREAVDGPHARESARGAASAGRGPLPRELPPRRRAGRRRPQRRRPCPWAAR